MKSATDRIIGLVGGLCFAMLAILVLGMVGLLVIGLWAFHPGVGVLALLVLATGAYLGWRE